MKFWKLAVWSLASVVGLGAISAMPAAAQESSSEIRIGWQPDPNVAFYLARDKQLFEKTGLKPQYIKFTASPPMFAALQSGSVDVVEIGLAPAIIGKSQGIDMTIFMVSVDVSNTNVLVVQPDQNVKSPADLKGKRVAALRGSTPYFGLIRYLNSAGLDLKDIEFVDLAAANVVPAFRRKEIDAVWVWAPWQNMLIGMGGKRVVSNQDVGALSPQVWAVRTEWAKNNPATLQKFLKAINGGFHAIKVDAPLAVKQLAETLNIAPDIAKQVLETNRYPDLAEQYVATDPLSLIGKDNNGGLKSVMKQASDFLLAQGIISKPAQIDGMLDARPVQQFLKAQ